LFNAVAARSEQVSWYIVDWRPANLAPSFHGRDLFAPIAARIAKHDFTWPRTDYRGPELEAWPADLDRLIYFDAYGNGMTGRRYRPDLTGRNLMVGDQALAEATTFGSVSPGTAFWYRNSIGLVEIAVNRSSARERLQLQIGTTCRFA
jgi:S-adenosylmethionine hydrolase